jgi:hypothetical protein
MIPFAGVQSPELGEYEREKNKARQKAAAPQPTLYNRSFLFESTKPFECDISVHDCPDFFQIIEGE